MKTIISLLILITLVSLSFDSDGQETPVLTDAASTPQNTIQKPVTQPARSAQVKIDTSHTVNYAKKAALRSALIPGWGQAYNKKYWKIPIVYAGIGISAYVFFDNINVYKEYKFAYAARIKAQSGIPSDSTDYYQLADLYKLISPESIRNGRDQFRRYIDYSVLTFILLWGLNVVDAAVDAHLRSFDISPDLSMKIKPSLNPVYNSAGISLVFTIGKNHTK
ncbi:MAG: hypothetical protein GC171_05105 [Terrimonas sp.]|nr:hypothetical protein [Terrimonas sp.]